MTLKEALMKEIETLPDERYGDVLSYVRFIKSGLADGAERKRQFAEALALARQTAATRCISDNEISEELEAVRKARW